VGKENANRRGFDYAQDRQKTHRNSVEKRRLFNEKIKRIQKTEFRRRSTDSRCWILLTTKVFLPRINTDFHRLKLVICFFDTDSHRISTAVNS